MKVGRWIMRIISALVIAAVVCVAVAAAVLGRKARAAMDESRDNTKSAYTQMETGVTEAFESVDIAAAEDMDVCLALSENGQGHVSYYDSDELTHSVRVENGVLTVSCTDERGIASDIGFGTDPYIIVSLPEADYERISVQTGDGNVSVGMQLSSASVDITTGKGDISMTNVTADELVLTTDSGDIALSTAEADSINISSATGDLSVMNVDTEAANIFTESGLLEVYDIHATVMLKCETGRGDISATGCSGGKLSFVSEKGDIGIIAAGEQELDAESGSGDVDVVRE